MEKIGTFVIGLAPSIVGWMVVILALSLVANLALGKFAMVYNAIAKLLVAAGEGEINRAFRKKVAAAAEKTPTIVKEALANMAARTDPDPNKKPESKARRFFKFLGRSVVAGILKR